MIDLAAIAGIRAWVDPQSAALEFASELTVEELSVRPLEAAREVYVDPPAEAAPLYHMANGIWHLGAVEPDSELRYELTALRPGAVGSEWVKTIGHIHDRAPDGIGYPEVYEVVAGEGVFVLFQLDPPVRLLIDAGPGESFVIPPGWHHFAVNPGTVAMVFADVVARAVAPDYSVLRRNHGGPFYLGPDGMRPNPAYPEGLTVRRPASEVPVPEQLDVLATTFFHDRGRLDYLLHPGRYRAVWDRIDSLFTE